MAAALSIPAQFRSCFTAAQAEELVAQFQLSDADGSGAIDELEFCALLRNLSLHVTAEEAGALVASIDTDGNGLVSFDELVAMVVRLQQGDPLFAKLRAFLDALDTTPTSLLEREAAKFSVQLTYQLIEQRVATKTTPAVCVMALTLAGSCIRENNGQLTLQAIGKTTREAKFKVAEAALATIKSLQPGLAYEPGELPLQWRQWLFDRLDSGSSVNKLMQKLKVKGFAPTRNSELMQRISTRVSSLKLRRQRSSTRRHSNNNSNSNTKKKANKPLPIYDTTATEPQGDAQPGGKQQHRVNGLHPLWVHWSQQELARGIDGRVVLDELVTLGFEPEKFPFETQIFTNASYLHHAPEPPLTPRSRSRQRRPSAERGGNNNCNNAVAVSSSMARRYCFWRCLEDGDVAETELFVYGGQDINAAQVDAATRVQLAPLQLVCKAGHHLIAQLLLENDATVDLRDAAQRTPLMLAAREGHRDVCALLLGHGASPVALDSLHNSPLHYAAMSGVRSVADLILEYYNEQLLVALASVPQRLGVGYDAVVSQAVEAVMHSRLRANERRRFHVSWCWDVWVQVHNRLFTAAAGSDGAAAPAPRRQLMDHVLRRYHPRFVRHRQGSEDAESEMGSDSESDEDEEIVDAGVRERRAAARVAKREWIPLHEVVFCVDRCIRESYKNAVNKQGRTALHVACDENLVCTHELVIQCLADTHGCDPELVDHGGCTPMDLVLACKGRPGSPRSDPDSENQILSRRRLRIDALDAQRERQRCDLKRAAWAEALAALSCDFQELEVLIRTAKAVKTGPPTSSAVGWDVYAEPLSGNRLFVNSASGFTQRQVPAALAAFTAERLAWKEKLVLRATFVEQHKELPEWEVHRVHSSDVYLFFNRVTTECRWLPPRETPANSYRTKRIFQDQTQMDDASDSDALALQFSFTFSSPLKNDCVRGRRVGLGWRECSLFGVVFYWHEASDAVAVDKPAEVLQGEATRYAQVLLRGRSEEIEELAGGWRRWYDHRSALSFYYDDDTGDCVLDVDADPSFLRRVRIRKNQRRIRESDLSTEERQKRLEEHEWKQTLERVRRREQQQQTRQQQAQRSDTQHEHEQTEHTEALRRLEASITSEHYDEARGKTLAYVDARVQREKNVFLVVKSQGGMVSSNPKPPRPRHEIDRAEALTRELDAQEREHAELEGLTEGSQAVAERRRVSRILWKTLERVRRDTLVCRYGCGLWFERANSLSVHERSECRRRRLVCRLGCGLVLEDRVWQAQIQAHEEPDPSAIKLDLKLDPTALELDSIDANQRLDADGNKNENRNRKAGYTNEKKGYANDQKGYANDKMGYVTSSCPARILACPRACGVFTPHCDLAHHMSQLCVRRPVGDLACRLGCGFVVTGGAHQLLALEQTRTSHEQDECELRKVQCTWPGCRGTILAKERNPHRRTHLISSGVLSFLTAEVHEYKVPKGTKQLKVQAWGGGGGSGLQKGQTVGHGGGGAFIEGVVNVHPGETLYFCIGAGGSGGRPAVMQQADGTDQVETVVSTALGGTPGGGDGHSGNKESACGGGGGFTSVYRHSAFGIEYILVAGGGGGGGTGRNGGGGSGLHAPRVTLGDEVRSGRPGGSQDGGQAGQCDEYNPICRFEGTNGESLKGGNGAEFGGGGGGGFYGGGGGGFSPGIVGGGGGGSSYVNTAVFEPKTVVVVPGGVVDPGGMDRSPPRSVRTAYWDVVDGVAGEGGSGSVTHTARGNHGGVRIARPGFYKDMHHHV